jgi:hypothetical protein
VRSGPSPIRGGSTILGHTPIPIAVIPIATDGLGLDAITAGRQIGRRKISLGILLGLREGWHHVKGRLSDVQMGLRNAWQDAGVAHN